jgi:hypothetical protein
VGSLQSNVLLHNGLREFRAVKETLTISTDSSEYCSMEAYKTVRIAWGFVLLLICEITVRNLKRQLIVASAQKAFNGETCEFVCDIKSQQIWLTEH